MEMLSDGGSTPPASTNKNTLYPFGYKVFLLAYSGFKE